MKLFRSALSWRSFPIALAVLLLLVAPRPSALGEPPKSLLPTFGNRGGEFSKQAKDDHAIHGWLPKGWIDNSRWAAVNVTYTKLTDSPDKDAAAVRISVEKVDDGQVQLTSFEGTPEYKKGTKYVVTGWVRSERFSNVKIGFREVDEPHAFYDQVDLSTGAEWKPFNYTFVPEMDCEAWLMFVINQPGTVDLAGISVTEQP